MASYYSEIKNLPRMTQEDLSALYLKDEVVKTDIDELIKDVENAISEIDLELRKINDEVICDRIFGFPNDNDSSPKKAKLEELLNKKQKLIKQLAKLSKSKCYRFLKGQSSVIRVYPSEETINKVTEAHLYLAYYAANEYYKKDPSGYHKHSFDDLFEIASETIIYAARQYVPGEQATFVTYASKCIDNRLKKEVFGEKKKATKANDFFTFEFERMNLARLMLLELERSNFLMPKDVHYSNFENILSELTSRKINRYYSLSKLSLRCNIHIKEFNARMYKCAGIMVPRIKGESAASDFMKLYNMLISQSLINELILEDDIWVIKSAMDNNKSPNSAILFEIYRIELYLQKLAAIRELMTFEKEYANEFDGLVPNEEKLYNLLVSRVYRLRRGKKSRFTLERKMRLSGLSEAYHNIYGSFPFEYDFRERVQDYINNLFDARIQKIDMNNPQLADEEFIAKYYKNGEWDFDLYYEDEFERIKDEKLKEIRKNTLANRQILNLIQFYEHYSSKIQLDDITSIFKSKKILDSLEALRDDNKEPRSPKQPLEEEVLENIGISMYENSLNELPDLERDVLKLWISSDGFKQHTLDEIANILNISNRDARNTQRRALRLLRKDTKLKEYLSEPIE